MKNLGNLKKEYYMIELKDIIYSKLTSYITAEFPHIC